MPTGIQTPLRHTDAQITQLHTVAVTQPIKLQHGVVAAALQLRLASCQPTRQRAFQFEVAIRADRGLRIPTTPAQTARGDVQRQRGVLGIAQIGLAIGADASIKHLRHQRVRAQGLGFQTEL